MEKKYHAHLSLLDFNCMVLGYKPFTGAEGHAPIVQLTGEVAIQFNWQQRTG